MSKTKKIVYASALFSALVILTGCFHAAKNPAAGNTNEDNAVITAPANAVSAEDQEIKDGKIIVDSVLAADTGWLVVHADTDGVPGKIVGQSYVQAGENKNVEVVLDLPNITPTLYAMLHTDAGEKNVYEFPGADEPVKFNDEIVMDSFAVTQGTSDKKDGAMMEKIEDTPSPSQPETSVIEVTAKKWEFIPSTITVKQGQRVRLNIQSIDVTHGLAIPDFDISLRLEPGTSASTEFIADKKGTFSFFCNVLCGEGHKDMRGTLIVE